MLLNKKAKKKLHESSDDVAAAAAKPPSNSQRAKQRLEHELSKIGQLLCSLPDVCDNIDVYIPMLQQAVKKSVMELRTQT